MTKVANQRRGFTLIELLIVIAIIGLLAAILFPVFASVREGARRTSCVSNLRQLGNAIELYLGDYDRYPHALDAADKYAPQIWYNEAMDDGFDLNVIPMLTDTLEPYVKNPYLWRCPSDTGFDHPDGIPWQLEDEKTYPSCFAKIDNNGRPYGSSYFYRTELMFRHLSQDPLRNPAGVNVLFDAFGSWHVPRLSLKKDKRYNILFADGHAKSTTEAEMQKAWSTPLL